MIGGKRVLVVDDYEDARILLQIILQDAGFDVVTASNGLEAIALARHHQPDLILMDLFMPGMDGFEATRHIRADPSIRQMPIVAHTARPSAASDGAELFAAICHKPCAPDRLLETVRRTLTA